jgi:uncharacterized membrane protein (DUF441 family)
VVDAVWILLGCAALGLLGRNVLIAGAALCLLALHLSRLQFAIRWLDERGTAVGIFLLVTSLLAPVAAGRLSLRAFAAELLRPSGLVGVAVAAVAAYLGRGGVDFLGAYPAALVGLVVGSVIGTIFLRGVPTGPLIAAGLTALCLRVLGWG